MYAKQGICKLPDICGSKYWPNGSKRVDAHFCRASAGEKTEDHFGEKIFVAAVTADLCKFGETLADLAPSLAVSSLYIVDRESCTFRLCHLA